MEIRHPIRSAATRPWLCHIAVGLILIAVYYAPVSSTVSSLIYDWFGLTAVVAILWATWRHRPSAPGLWFLLAAGIGLLTAGDLWWTYDDLILGVAPPFPSLADALYLAAYPVIAAALYGFARRRSRGSDRGTLIDAAIIGLSYAVAAWFFFLEPYLSDPNYPLFERVVSAAYPAADVPIVAAVALLLLTPGRRSPSFYLLCGGSAVYVAADIFYARGLLTDSYLGGSAMEAVWMLGALAWGAAALHPSMRDLAVSDAALDLTLTRRRLGLLTAAAVAVPVLHLAHPDNGAADRYVGAGATGLLFFLVILRLSGLLRVVDRAHRSFRALVQRGNELITVMNADGTIRYASPSYAEVLGYQPDEVIGREGVGLIAPEDRPLARDLLVKLTSGPGAPHTVEIGVRHADGSRRTVEATLINLLDDPDVRGLVVNSRDVTARKEADDALRTAQTLNASVIESSDDGIFAFDASHRLTIWNPSMERSTGLPNALVLGHDLFVLFPFLRETGEDALVLAALRGESGVAPVTPNRMPETGQEGFYEARYAPLHDIDGRVVGGLGVVRDVTARVRAETALQTSERDLRRLFELAGDAILVFDPTDEVILDANASACSLYGFSRDEIIGRSLLSLSSNPVQAQPQLDALLRGRANVSFETVQYRSDGTPLTLEVNTSLVEYRGRPAILSINRDVTAQKTLEAELAHRAFHDALTGLPNRALFNDRLAHALTRAGRRGEPVAVLLLDLDRFKLVNDGLGHAAGDRLLVAVAQRLATCVRDADTLARLGGDEFAVLLEDASPDLAREVAERILTALADPVLVEGREIYSGSSIGIVVSTPDRSAPDELLRAADVALYRAKHAGRGTLVVFDPAATDPTAGWLALEADLRRAIVRGELILHYQPVVTLDEGDVVNVEALVRWNHPTRGMLPPGEFIPLAEETGLITTITSWAIDEACRQQAEWRQTLGPLAPPSVSVNLTTRDLRDPEFVGRIRQALAATGLSPSNLRLEVTERVLVEEIRAATEALRDLRACGIVLAIDDFGAGASSLASLRAVEVKVLKLDRTFVRDMETSEDARVVVGAIAAMAHALGMQVTAEGIETAAQFKAARAAGCNRG